MPSDGAMKDVLGDRLTWPTILTPELREQLLLDKIARVQQAIVLRKKYPYHIRHELNVVCCNGKECQHN